MSVPLDRLYNFVNDHCDPYGILIYRFQPHGSKNPRHISPLLGKAIQPENIVMICHDQEPLDRRPYVCYLPALINQECLVFKNVIKTDFSKPLSLYNKMLLLHSEHNSSETSWFENHGCIGVYWWSHAVIALDWYRYAQFDQQLDQAYFIKDFLIYNRAWTGTREYRLTFTEMIIDQDLAKHCQMTFNPIDEGQDYRHHTFRNFNLKISRFDLEKFLGPSTSTGQASADYSAEDYQQCWIDVVLETIFDDARNHLTEKILRPIACGKPFILASSPGSLAYLRRYGFQTFGSCWSEDYDEIVDPLQRLSCITDTMRHISQLSVQQKKDLQNRCQAICHHNKARFFSREFFEFVTGELRSNVQRAVAQIAAYKTIV